ncbi:HNH endonuclease signature motif containing protein [Aeromicrobium duanguangcaii]|uniref:HNH endonuclease n=1 Tax=Aeromicrobium duanguangcaii TaxID=2968086 RepID=A0ABY5KLK1_9ACTN|nr:HNH endonuclease signature motif containing protein [Aeromicrobium duanguangcaii]MCD9152969.1 HNH endonuclease [Aeromicrobium duanguangcaii]UUI69925.1 HNH endonuclease [Aeromicrobium duanguangcaii]
MEFETTAGAFDGVRRARAMAEFAEWQLITRHHDRRVAEIDRSDDIVLSKELARREVTLEIAQALRVTERHVWAIVFETETLRERTPAVWAAFRVGDVDASRASAIADTAERLTERESWEALERAAITYASTHTVGELKGWLRRFRARIEPEQAAAETARAVETRRVSVTHNDDGTSWLNALLPTGVAIAAAERLRKAARALPGIDPETDTRDTRTRDQKQADILGHWLTSCTGTSTDIRAEIAISIAATDLIGLTTGPGITRDGEPLGHEWVRELAASEHTVFRRLVLDPMGGVLDTTVLAYRPTESLRQALHWRDGTCRVAGCRAPVFETDLDHAQDYDSGGETSARNLRCLCRKHHNMKSHGHLAERHLDPPASWTERYVTSAPPLLN